jgi:hypothetical protein
MLFLTERAELVCKHGGKVKIEPTQELVTIEGWKVLVDSNPENRTVSGCPNYGATIKPCRNTLAVKTGYSEFLRIEGQRVCLDTVSGFTDGTPPGVVKYIVKTAGQDLVWEGLK